MVKIIVYEGWLILRILVVVGLFLGITLMPVSCSFGDPIDVMYIEDIYTYNETGTNWVEVMDLAGGGGGSGVSDHGELDGLSDDDHTQYALDTDLSTHEADTSTHGVSEVAGIEDVITDHGELSGLSDDDHSQYAFDSDITSHAGNTSTHGVNEIAGIEDIPDIGIICYVRLNSNQSINTVTWTTVEYDTENVNESDMYDSDTGIFTANGDMLVLVETRITIWNLMDNKWHYYGIFVNDAYTIFNMRYYKVSSYGTDLLCGVLELDSGDELEVRTYHDTGYTEDIFGSGYDYNYLKITKLKDL